MAKLSLELQCYFFEEERPAKATLTKILQRIELITRPRLSYICTSLPGRVWEGYSLV